MKRAVAVAAAALALGGCVVAPIGPHSGYYGPPAVAVVPPAISIAPAPIYLAPPAVVFRPWGGYYYRHRHYDYR